MKHVEAHVCLFLIRNIFDLFLLFYFIISVQYVSFWKYIHCKKMEVSDGDE